LSRTELALQKHREDGVELVGVPESAWKDKERRSENIDDKEKKERNVQRQKILVNYFTCRRIVQSHGLDETRTDAANEGGAAIALVMETVLGKREVYWEKVAEKVRRQAVVVTSSLRSSWSRIAERIMETRNANARDWKR